jgi:hypothetical protein
MMNDNTRDDDAYWPINAIPDPERQEGETHAESPDLEVMMELTKMLQLTCTTQPVEISRATQCAALAVALFQQVNGRMPNDLNHLVSIISTLTATSIELGDIRPDDAPE